jgi:hypothetical protein
MSAPRERMRTQKKPSFLWAAVWSWPVVGGIVILLLGGGVSAMTSTHPWIADGFFVVAFPLLISKLLQKEIRQTRVGKLIMSGLSVIVVILVWGNHYINRAIPISVSPREVSVTSNEWHDVEEITISNNDGHPRYSVWFSAKPSDANVEFSLMPISGPGSDAGDWCLILEDQSLMWPIIRIAPHGYVIFRVDSHLKREGIRSKISFNVSEGSQDADDRTRRTYK